MISSGMTASATSNSLFWIFSHLQVQNFRIIFANCCLGKWTINGLYDIKLPPGMDPAKAAKGLGQIYLQVNFMANGIPDNAVEPPISDDIEAQIKVKQEKVEGTLFVNIIHAKDLLPVDDDSSTSDPYVKVSVGQKSFETKPMKKTLNPIWNLTGSKLPISEQKSSMHTLTINVVDHNALLSNTLIGMKELKLDDFIAEPGKNLIYSAYLTYSIFRKVGS